MGSSPTTPPASAEAHYGGHLYKILLGMTPMQNLCESFLGGRSPGQTGGSYGRTFKYARCLCVMPERVIDRSMYVVKSPRARRGVSRDDKETGASLGITPYVCCLYPVHTCRNQPG